jgi:hypothetical protein
MKGAVGANGTDNTAVGFIRFPHSPLEPGVLALGTGLDARLQPAIITP